MSFRSSGRPSSCSKKFRPMKNFLAAMSSGCLLSLIFCSSSARYAAGSTIYDGVFPCPTSKFLYIIIAPLTFTFIASTFSMQFAAAFSPGSLHPFASKVGESLPGERDRFITIALKYPSRMRCLNRHASSDKTVVQHDEVAAIKVPSSQRRSGWPAPEHTSTGPKARTPSNYHLPPRESYASLWTIQDLCLVQNTR